MRKLLVLLGAGASDGYAPGTRRLTDELLSSRSGAEGVQLFRKVRAGLREHFAQRKELAYGDAYDPTFEEIIEVVDEIASHLPRRYRSGDSFLSPFVSLGSALRPLTPSRDRYVRYATRARKFILTKIRQHCDRSADPRGHPLARALAVLAERARLRLMSLNYDDLPIGSGIDFYTGFAGDEQGCQTFKPSYPWPSDRHAWCQLHGSVLFRVKVSGVGGYEIVRYPTRRDAARHRWSDAYERAHQDRHVAPLSPIVTGLRKADSIQSEPFASYAHMLREEALTCDRWLIIGYGGRDPHINNLLLQARAHRLRTGSGFRVVFVGHAGWAMSRAVSLGNFLHQPEGFEEQAYALNWFFNLEAPRGDAYIEPFSVSPMGPFSAISLDGVAWAMDDGLKSVVEFLHL